MGEEPVIGRPIEELLSAGGEQASHGVTTEAEQAAQREGLGALGDALLGKGGEGLGTEFFDGGEEAGRVFLERKEADVEGVACSPGVRWMMAVVGSDTSFEQGREQLWLRVGVAVTAKAVERHAETIGAGIEACKQEEIRRAKQLELPAYAPPPHRSSTSRWTARACPWCKRKPKAARASWKANRRTRARSNWVASSLKPVSMKRAGPFATRIPLLTSSRSRPPRRSTYGSTTKPGGVVGAARRRKS